MEQPCQSASTAAGVTGPMESLLNDMTSKEHAYSISAGITAMGLPSFNQEYAQNEDSHRYTEEGFLKKQVDPTLN